jgi:uncharacterized protein YqeY
LSILQKLEDEIKTALKARDEVRLGTARLIKSTVKNKEIELIRPLTETEFFAVLGTMVKQRKESIDQFTKGNRLDLAKKEEEEIKVIETFLPQALGDSEVAALIDSAVAESGAKGPKDMGAVMKILKDKTAGRVDGRLLSEKVKQKLATLS